MAKQTEKQMNEINAEAIAKLKEEGRYFGPLSEEQKLSLDERVLKDLKLKEIYIPKKLEETEAKIALLDPERSQEDAKVLPRLESLAATLQETLVSVKDEIKEMEEKK